MSNGISLKETERKVFQSAFQDGLIDISIGCSFLVFAIAPLLSTHLGDFWSTVVSFLPLWTIVFPALWLIRKYVVRPRTGIVKYGSWRKSRIIRFNVLILFFFIFAGILGTLSAVKFDAVPGWVHTARFSLILLVGFSVAGYFLDFSRLYLYGALVALAPLIGELLHEYWEIPHHGFPVAFGFTASLVIVTGLVLFIRLLQDHPLPAHQAGPQKETE